MDTVHNVVCPHCAAVNRIGSGRDPMAGRCGACHAPLFGGDPVDAGAGMYERQIARSDIPVLVDVWAPWCGPCRAMAPALAEASRTLEPTVRVIKLNSEAEPAIAGQIGVRAVPTMILFRKGREIARTSGAMGARQIVDWVGSRLRAA